MFSDHDNLSNAAAAAPAPQAETAPNSAHLETNSTLESRRNGRAPLPMSRPPMLQPKPTGTRTQRTPNLLPPMKKRPARTR